VPGDHDDAAVGHREALGIPRPIETNALAGWNRYALLDDAVLQVRALSDGHVLEQ
jgi:hypothetical protein